MDCSTAALVIESAMAWRSAALMRRVYFSGSERNLDSATSFPKWILRERAWRQAKSQVAVEP